jgi:hypothetical protein
VEQAAGNLTPEIEKEKQVSYYERMSHKSRGKTGLGLVFSSLFKVNLRREACEGPWGAAEATAM